MCATDLAHKTHVMDLAEKRHVTDLASKQASVECVSPVDAPTRQRNEWITPFFPRGYRWPQVQIDEGGGQLEGGTISSLWGKMSIFAILEQQRLIMVVKCVFTHVNWYWPKTACFRPENCHFLATLDDFFGKGGSRPQGEQRQNWHRRDPAAPWPLMLAGIHHQQDVEGESPNHGFQKSAPHVFQILNSLPQKNREAIFKQFFALNAKLK